jgi:hypothetical protein
LHKASLEIGDEAFGMSPRSFGRYQTERQLEGWHTQFQIVLEEILTVLIDKKFFLEQKSLIVWPQLEESESDSRRRNLELDLSC